MKKLLPVILIFLYTLPLQSQINQDTIVHRTVGPGVTYTRIVDSLVPWSIDVLRIEMNNPYIKLETVKALDRMASGREKTSSMAARRNQAGHQVVGAVNADFFEGTGLTLNTQIERGEIIKRENGWDAFGFNDENKLSMNAPAFTGKFIAKNGLSLNITGINSARDSGKTILYNKFFANQTGTNNEGTEVLIRPLNKWWMNDTVICIVDSVGVLRGNHSLAAHTVISSHGTGAQFLSQNTVKGDTIKMLLNLLPGLKRLTGMVGGRPAIVINGATANLNTGDPFVTARHPRTGVGFNQDSTILYLFTVDGRQAHSKGMNLFEFADLMLSHGIYTGINLDGGGSTAMVVRGSVMNSPSDPTGEREVANALLVISSAPIGTLHHIEIYPRLAKVFSGTQIQFSVSATDEYYNPVPIPPGSLQFSLSKPSLGTVSQNGIYVAGTLADTGWLYVSYGNIKDSARIISKALNFITVEPKFTITDLNRIVNFTGRAFDTDSVEQAVPQQNYTWKSTDTLVGKIDAVGQFQGRSEGETKIIAQYQNFRDTSIVRVELGTGSHFLDSLESISGWSVTGENYDSIYTAIRLSDSNYTVGSNSLQLDYRFVYQPGMFNYVYLNTDIPIYGLPDSLMIDVMSDGRTHRVFFDVADQRGAKYRMAGHKIANKNGIYETIRAALPKNSIVIYPLSLRTVTLALGSTQAAGQTYTGVLYFDNIRTKFPAVTSVKEIPFVPGTLSLGQNYPNPFNPDTEIPFVLSKRSNVSLVIYDILGREIARPVSGEYPSGSYSIAFKGTDLSSGIYIYALRDETGTILSRKMSLMK